VFAEQSGAFSAPGSTKTESRFDFDYGSDWIAEYTVDERAIDRFGLFDASDSGNRYDVSLDVEDEDGEWSFEVTVTVEF